MPLRTLLPSLVLMLGSTSLNAEGPPTAASLDHVAIYVQELDRSTAFYKRVLGLHEIEAPFPIARWLVLGNGLTLHIVSGRSEPLKESKWDHFAVSCADMKAMIAHLDAHHVAWSDIQGKPAPQVRPDGVQQIFVQDPDGYWIEINDMLKARSATPSPLRSATPASAH